MANNSDLVKALLEAAKEAGTAAGRTGPGGPTSAAYAQSAKTLLEAAELASKLPEPGSIA